MADLGTLDDYHDRWAVLGELSDEDMRLAGADPATTTYALACIAEVLDDR